MNKVCALSFTVRFAKDKEKLPEVNNFYFNLFDKLLMEIREKKRIDNVKKVN